MDNSEFIVKKHVSSRKILLAVCDSSIIGKKYEEGKMQLDLSSSFYKGENKTEGELIDLIKKTYIINAAGKKSVDFLVKNGFADSSAVIKISGIPHIQILLGNES
jgi:hypothetical protein